MRPTAGTQGDESSQTQRAALPGNGTNGEEGLFVGSRRRFLTAVLLTVGLISLGTLSAASPRSPQPPKLPCGNAIDYIDPTYGATIRQLENPAGHEHNLYFHRNPWNADSAYMVAIESDLAQGNWRVVLYDGDGCYLKDLFTVDQYDWRLVWDRHDPDILYTWQGSVLYRYDVGSDLAQPLKSFAPLGIKPTGLSLNQAGDRILVVTSDLVFHSYHLPDMTDERAFSVVFPPGCTSSWRDQRYIGFANYIVTGCTSGDIASAITDIYDDTGTLLHRFNGVGMGHSDFSPTGRWAYGRWAESAFELHVVNIDGSKDTIVFGVALGEMAYVQNWHISWPDRVNDWFVVSFFPNAESLPSSYAPLLDEIILVRTDGTAKFLARSETAYSTGFFWAQPLASPSGDGKRIAFNSNRDGTIDQYILYVAPSTGGRRP